MTPPDKPTFAFMLETPGDQESDEAKLLRWLTELRCGLIGMEKRLINPDAVTTTDYLLLMVRGARFTVDSLGSLMHGMTEELKARNQRSTSNLRRLDAMDLWSEQVERFLKKIKSRQGKSIRVDYVEEIDELLEGLKEAQKGE